MSYEHEIDSNAQVAHKERGKEKGKSPYNPLKEKESQKEISAFPSPFHARACMRAQENPPQNGKGKGEVGLRQFFREGKGKAFPKVTAEMILDGRREDGLRNDPVQIAIAALRLPMIAEYTDGRRYDHARLLRWCLNKVGEECFRDTVYQQWRENAVDGEPNNRACAIMAKFNKIIWGGGAE